MHTIASMYWLDLEQTIISDWRDPVLCNVDRIKAFLRSRAVTEIRIFSFAIWDEVDKHHFEDTMKPMIEEALGVSILCWPSVVDMMRVDQKVTNNHPDSDDLSDFIAIRGKADAFRNYVLGTARFDLAVLIDDVIPNMTIIDRDTNSTIELWNVDSLPVL